MNLIKKRKEGGKGLNKPFFVLVSLAFLAFLTSLLSPLPKNNSNKLVSFIEACFHSSPTS